MIGHTLLDYLCTNFKMNNDKITCRKVIFGKKIKNCIIE